MQWIYKDTQSNQKGGKMIFLKANRLKEVLKLYAQNPSFALMAGGSDLNLVLFKGSFKYEGVIVINQIKKLAKIKEKKNSIEIGALCSITDMLESSAIKEHFPIFAQLQNDFASKQIRNVATIGGNIANASPFSDLIPLLLVLSAKVTVASAESKREIALKDLYQGFKSLDLNNEIIVSINLPIRQQQCYYRKVAPRKRLAIVQLSLVVSKAKKYRISGSALNSYHRRFRAIEKVFNSHSVDDRALKKAIKQDISPSSSYRSNPKYKEVVLFNMLKEAYQKLQK